METKKASKTLLERLPVYLNYIRNLPAHTENISATKMAKALGLGDVLVRKDLAKVSKGGRRKLGHIREDLIRDIEDFLDMDRITYAIIVGAGKLGQALLEYGGFEKCGLHILAGFDISPVDWKTEGRKPVYPISTLADFCQCHNVEIGIITVPENQAQQVCDQLVACEIEAIWNFSSSHLTVPKNVVVQNENLAVSLTALKMRLKEQKTEKSA